MGVYVDLIEEVRSRLSEAQGDGKILDMHAADGLEAVYVGLKTMVEGLAEMPSAIVTISNSTEELAVIRQGQLNAVIGVEVIIKYPLYDNASTNRLYDTDSGVGFMYFVEKVLDVLNQRIDGTMDPRMRQSSLKPALFQIQDIEYYMSYIVATIRADVRTGFYSFNRRESP